MNNLSKQREAIIRSLRNTKSHPTVEWIYEQVKKEIPRIGLATIYRNLKLFAENGTILELKLPDGLSHYDGDTSIHHHFYCDICGRIYDLFEPEDISLSMTIAEKTGLKVTHHHLALRGVCQDCQRLNAGKNNKSF